MNLIVNVDQNWGIGKSGALLVVLKGDMKYFKEKTSGKVVVYGRETLQTFPKGNPLPNRTNIILSRNTDFQCEGAIVVHSLEVLLKTLEGYPTDDVFIIGGASIYNQTLPYVKTAYVTKFHKTNEADKYFPNLDDLPGWRVTQTSELQEEADIQYQFHVYVNDSLS